MLILLIQIYTFGPTEKHKIPSGVNVYLQDKNKPKIIATKKQKVITELFNFSLTILICKQK